MAKLAIYHPIKPAALIQPFGTNSAYYARFLDASGNPEKGHPGLDFQAPHATPLYCPVDGYAAYKSDDRGGAGIYVVQNCDDGYFAVILWHLCTKDDPQFAPLIPTDGSWTKVKVSQLIGYSDNSGAPFESTGDHLHLGLLPLTKSGTPLNPNNGYGGCIDPAPYLNGKFAEDISTATKIVQVSTQVVSNISAGQYPNPYKLAILSQITKVVMLLKQLIS